MSRGFWRIQFDGKVWLSILTLASKKFQSSSSDILRPSEKKNLSSKRWMLLWKDGVLWFASFLFPCLIFIDVFLGLVVQLDFLKQDRTSFLLTLKRRCTPLTNRCLQWVTQTPTLPPLEQWKKGPLVVQLIWVVVSNIFYVHPYLGKIPILTNIFQRGSNHQLVI